MDDQHPLTNEMCHELSCWPLEELDELYVEGTMTDMRAAYDLAIEHVVKLWRDIAETADNDFQLVIRFHSYLYDMRSQQQEDS